MRNFKEYLNESENAQPEVGDVFDIELLNDNLVETTILEVVEDGVVIALDETAIKILETHGHYLEERAVSKAQQRFMGMVHAAQKGEKPASKEVAKVAKDMGKQDAKDFAKTKHKGLPDHVDESAGFSSPEQEAKIRARLEQVQERDPDNSYKIVADEFDMTEEELRDALHHSAKVDEAHDDELELIRQRAGIKKSDVPAVKRKAAGEKPLSHDDLRKEKEMNISGPEGLAALRRRMGDLEESVKKPSPQVQQVIDQLLDGELDAYDVMNSPQGPAQEEMSQILQDMYDDISIDHHIHPDDGFEKILDIAMDHLANDYGHSSDHEVNEGLKGWILGGAATLAAILGGNHLQYQHALKNDPQLVKLVQYLEVAKQRGDEDKVRELEDRIKKTYDHNTVLDRPVLGQDGKPVEPEYESEMDEAKYHGKEVPLGKKLPGDVKKSKVYVRKPNGNIVKVNFGDPNMRIKKSNPKRRKSFRARHNCDNPGPRWKARYWSCRSW